MDRLTLTRVPLIIIFPKEEIARDSGKLPDTLSCRLGPFNRLFDPAIYRTHVYKSLAFFSFFQVTL